MKQDTCRSAIGAHSEDLSRPTIVMDYNFLKPNSDANSETIPAESVTCSAVKGRQTPEHFEQRDSEEGD